MQVRDRQLAIAGRAHPIPSALITVATPARVSRLTAFHPAAPKSIQRSARYRAHTSPRLSAPKLGCLLVLFAAFAR
jgi:hypothetical protein